MPCSPSLKSVYVSGCVQTFAARPALASYAFTSMYLVNSVNHFGNAGGFHLMVERLKDGKALPFWLVHSIVNVRSGTGGGGAVFSPFYLPRVLWRV